MHRDIKPANILLTPQAPTLNHREGGGSDIKPANMLLTPQAPRASARARNWRGVWRVGDTEVCVVTRQRASAQGAGGVCVPKGIEPAETLQGGGEKEKAAGGGGGRGF